MIQKLIICMILLNIVISLNPDPTEYELEFLRKYNYLNGNTEDEDISEAICKFQKFNEIPTTCNMNEETRTLMDSPRCGLPDIRNNHADIFGEFNLNTKWNKKTITWKINRYSTNLLNSDVLLTVRRAFNIWQAVCDLTFEEKVSETVDIDIGFYKGEVHSGYLESYDKPFNATTNVLAHAFFPYAGGDIHINDYKTFTLSYSGPDINLLEVLVHELGHSLGLRHEPNVSSSIMMPFYSNTSEVKLGQDDIDAIQTLYGRPQQEQTTKYNSNVTVNFCDNPYFDAYIIFLNNDFIFSGNSFRVNNNTYERKMYFGGLLINNKVDAAIVVQPQTPRETWINRYSSYDNSSKVYIFQTKYVHIYEYQNNTFVQVYKRNIGSLFIGVPNDIDAAFIWHPNQKIHLVKGEKYYRVHFNKMRNVYILDRGYPKEMSLWSNIPTPIECAIANENYTLFFHAKNLYPFSTQHWKVFEGYPRSQAAIFGCTSVTSSPLSSDVKYKLSSLVNKRNYNESIAHLIMSRKTYDDTLS